MTAAVRVRDRIVAEVDAEGLGAYGVHVLVGDNEASQYVVVDDPADAVVTITAHEEHRDHRLAELAASALAS